MASQRASGECAQPLHLTELCEAFPDHADAILRVVGALEHDPDPEAHGGAQIPNAAYEHVYEFMIDDSTNPPFTLPIVFAARPNTHGIRYMWLIDPREIAREAEPGRGAFEAPPS